MSEPAGTPEDGRRQGKSAAAFRTISEVAKDLDVPPHVLRFWESKFAQVKPLKRGGGRRYYRPEDVDLLRGIRELLYTDGYTIKGVQKLLRESGVKAVSGILPGQASVPAADIPPEVKDTPAADPATGETALAVLGPAQRAALEAVLTDLDGLRELVRS